MAFNLLLSIGSHLTAIPGCATRLTKVSTNFPLTVKNMDWRHGTNCINEKTHKAAREDTRCVVLLIILNFNELALTCMSSCQDFQRGKTVCFPTFTNVASSTGSNCTNYRGQRQRLTRYVFLLDTIHLLLVLTCMNDSKLKRRVRSFPRHVLCLPIQSLSALL